MTIRFDFEAGLRRELGHQLIEILDQYFASLPARAVQLPAAERSFRALTGRMPEHGEDPATILNEIGRELIDKGFHVPSANYFGLMNPTPAYMAVLAEALVAALNPQLATQARSQLASKIENETLRWIGERVGWAGEFGGTFTSGGNEANMSALAIALQSAFPQMMEDGVRSLSGRPVCYASSESHHSLDKAAALLGLGRSALRRIPVNGRLQLDPARLAEAIVADRRAGRLPFAIVATAGTTNSGAIDDLSTLSSIAGDHNLWLHVDGAYGAAVIFSDRHRHLVAGIETADSITIDPHKWLAMPFAAGVLLTSHPALLELTFGTHTPYMPRVAGATVPDNFKVSMQWSRRMNSLKLWLTLRVHGRRAYEELIAKQLGLTQRFAERVAASERFDLVVPPVLPILNLRLKGVHPADLPARHEALVEAVTRSGERWISTTQVDGQSVIRVMVISYLTEQQHLDALWASLEQAAGSR